MSSSDDVNQPLVDCSNHAEVNNRRKKIKYTLADIMMSSIFGVVLCFVDVVGDVFSAVQLYYTRNGNYSSDGIENDFDIARQDITHDGINSSNLYFEYSICILVISSSYISLKSVVLYWRNEREKLQVSNERGSLESLWISLRWLFHLLLVAPAARTVDLIVLRKKCQSLDDDSVNGHDHQRIESEKLFNEQVKPREQELTHILHQENSFESGPQLWLKMHMLCLYLLSGKPFWSYGYWNLIFICVGIFSCSWKTVCNRKTNNLANDEEKKFSLRKHIAPLLIGHCFSVGTRFYSLGMLSATCFSGLRILCEVHIFTVFIATAMYKTEGGTSFFNPHPNWGSLWNKISDFFNVLDVLFSSLFSFLDFDEEKDKTLRFIVYYFIPFFENVMVIFSFALMSQVPDGALALHFTAFVALFFSLIFFYVCENFQLEVPSPSSSSSSINSIDTSHQEEDGGSNAQLSNTANNVDHQSSFQCTNETENQVTSSLAPNNKTGSSIPMNGRSPETAVAIAWWRRWTIEGLFYRFRRKEKEKKSDVDSSSSASEDEDGRSETIGTDLSSNSPNGKEPKTFGESMIKMRYKRLTDKNRVRRRRGKSKWGYDFEDSDDDYGEDSDNHYGDDHGWSTGKTWKKMSSRKIAPKSDDERPGSVRTHFSTSSSSDEETGTSGGAILHFRRTGTGTQLHIKQIKSFEEEFQDARETEDLIWLCTNYQEEDLLEVVAELIEKGANVDATGNNRDTALYRLCRNYQYKNLIDVANLLIGKSKSPPKYVNAKGRSGRTAFQGLLKFYQHDNLMDIVKLFLDKGADVYPEDVIGETPIECLLEGSYKGDDLLQILEFIIEKGAQMNHDGHKKDGRTALHWLCKYCDRENLIEMVRSLIEKSDVDLNAKDSRGKTALLLICENYRIQGPKQQELIEIVKLLIHKGANVNAADLEGRTPLLFLCWRCRYANMMDIIQLLIDTKGNPEDDPIGLKVKELLGKYQGDWKKLRQVYDEWEERRSKKPTVASD